MIAVVQMVKQTCTKVVMLHLQSGLKVEIAPVGNSVGIATGPNRWMCCIGLNDKDVPNLMRNLTDHRIL